MEKKMIMNYKKKFDEIRHEENGVDFVLVFKLSRFGRNAADVLSSLQLMKARK